jgi:hypothetical protein
MGAYAPRAGTDSSVTAQRPVLQGPRVAKVRIIQLRVHFPSTAFLYLYLEYFTEIVTVVR